MASELLWTTPVAIGENKAPLVELPTYVDAMGMLVCGKTSLRNSTALIWPYVSVHLGSLVSTADGDLHALAMEISDPRGGLYYSMLLEIDADPRLRARYSFCTYSR